MILRQCVKLFDSGGGKAVRIPPAFGFVGDEVIISTDGQNLFIEAVKTQSPADLLPTLSLGMIYSRPASMPEK